MTEERTLCAIDRGKLIGALKAVLPSASADLTRPHLAGVLMETLPKTDSRDATLRFVSTDGHRLTRLDVATHADWGTAKGSALLPYEHVKALIASLRCVKRYAYQPVEIRENGAITFQDAFDKTAVTITPSDETFPPYERVIPKKQSAGAKGTGVIRWNARYMADVAKVADFCANEKGGGVEVSIAGDRDPVRIDMKNHDMMAEAVVVVMPMRI